MTIIKHNIFDLTSFDSDSSSSEIISKLLVTEELSIEKIVSFGRPKIDNWYDQIFDEWVIILKGSASLEFENNEIIELIEGDYLFIPSHKKHRVLKISEEQPCFWLAIHGKLTN
jgi:cupin 2 domain-containing protein